MLPWYTQVLFLTHFPHPSFFFISIQMNRDKAT